MRMCRVAMLLGIAVSGASAQAQPFRLLVSETARNAGAQSTWGGIREYIVSGPGGTVTQGNGIAASLLADPTGMAFNGNGVLYVANRHGTTGQGSVSRFSFDGQWRAGFTIGGPYLKGPTDIEFEYDHWFHAVNGDGTISVNGGPTYEGMDSFGLTRYEEFPSAFVTTDGVSNAAGVLYGQSLTNVVGIAGAIGLRRGVSLNGSMYFAASTSGTVHRLYLQSFQLGASSLLAHAEGASSIAFSPDGNEMFVGSETTGLISRFLKQGYTWTPNGSIATGGPVGDIVLVPSAVPEPATLSVLGLGLLVALKRRRR